MVLAREAAAAMEPERCGVVLLAALGSSLTARAPWSACEALQLLHASGCPADSGAQVRVLRDCAELSGWGAVADEAAAAAARGGIAPDPQAGADPQQLDISARSRPYLGHISQEGAALQQLVAAARSAASDAAASSTAAEEAATALEALLALRGCRDGGAAASKPRRSGALDAAEQRQRSFSRRYSRSFALAADEAGSGAGAARGGASPPPTGLARGSRRRWRLCTRTSGCSRSTSPPTCRACRGAASDRRTVPHAVGTAVVTRGSAAL